MYLTCEACSTDELGISGTETRCSWYNGACNFTALSNKEITVCPRSSVNITRQEYRETNFISIEVEGFEDDLDYYCIYRKEGVEKITPALYGNNLIRCQKPQKESDTDIIIGSYSLEIAFSYEKRLSTPKRYYVQEYVKYLDVGTMEVFGMYQIVI